MEVKEYNELCALLTTGTLPTSADSKNSKRVFKRKASNYIVEENTLFYKKGNNVLKVVQQPEVAELLNRYHCLLGAHKGQNATWKSLASEFYWPSMYQTVANFVKHCDRCQRNTASLTVSPALHPIAVNRTLFDRWGIDLAGPYRVSKNGNKFVVIATEYLTRWVEAKAMPNKTAPEVSKFLKSLVCRFGVMNVLQSDQGTEFCNSIVDNLELQLDFKHKISAA